MHIVMGTAPDGGDGHRAQILTGAGTPAGAELVVPAGELAAFVAEWEESARRAGTTPPRWTWERTAGLYPELLAAGVRVERCHDLRLCQAILATAATAHGSGTGGPLPYRPALAPLPGDEAPGLLPPPRPAPGQSSLFDLPRPAGPGTAELAAELRAQLAAVAGAADPRRMTLLLAAESQGALIAAEMQHAGVPWREDVHRALLEAALGPEPLPGERPEKMERTVRRLREVLHAPGLNPDSPQELLKALRAAGVDVTSTRQWELVEWARAVPGLAAQRQELIEPVLEHKKQARLLSANGWHWLDTWVRDGRFHPEYVVGGVVTGRWAARGGGALQIPHVVRDAVRADPGRVLVVADAAQLEPRVLAALAHDDALAAASHGRDLYQAIADLGEERGTELTERPQAKVAMLGAMYGATTGQSGRLMPHLARMFPRAVDYVERAARVGETGGQVRTHLGRWSPPPGPAWEAAQRDTATAEAERRAGAMARGQGRFTRNFVVQGTAAEWAMCWMGSIRSALAREGLDAELVFFLHDEIVLHCAQADAARACDLVRGCAEQAGRIVFGRIPVEFPVSVAVVASYADAK
ncbi:bifunctional 3'-5' exonuclease/DNA polymerase [Kocuria rosea]|uniref:bifunctional 3'-5' exonuclease/DNA polymerase n=1 Tax=Kocuria rosea TaxID=1275 RepID=UPI00203C7856|nr:bifunctional 3'-5' exonuclease/DNA polymerase [Kocuria rosea]MCM3688730.1 bifunctional 3'-5' exonuclease/DNA polymerase [Kocuria rosea]